MKSFAIVIAAAIVLIPVEGFAQPNSLSDIKERVLDRLYPHRVKRVPIPRSKPSSFHPYDLPDSGVTELPKPEAAPLTHPAVAWPKPETIPDEPSAPAATVSPPQQQQRLETPKPRARQERSREKEPSIQTRQQRQQQQAPAPKAACTPLPKKSCSEICGYARSMSEATANWWREKLGYCAPTASQERAGKDCIRRLCPDALTK